MKILHTADWHLDAPLQGYTQQQTETLKKALLSIPQQVADLCRKEACDLVLLAGDLFDGAYTQASYRALYKACAEMAVPVFIAPGNHDYLSPESPYIKEIWPENVHIFTQPAITSVAVPQLNARIYGAGFTSMDCPGLLQNFTAEAEEAYTIGILHGDATQTHSPYCPITKKQVEQSGLSYLALGHIHKNGAFSAGKTLCTWPGCPMGKGFDETQQKGILLVDLNETVKTRFVPLSVPQFFDLTVEAGDDGDYALSSVLPPMENEDFYRITFTGNSEPLDLPGLRAAYARFPNLELRDETLPPLDIWRSVNDDSLEGHYFALLKDTLENAQPDTARQILLAAKLSRQILDGQEVVLP